MNKTILITAMFLMLSITATSAYYHNQYDQGYNTQAQAQARYDYQAQPQARTNTGNYQDIQTQAYTTAFRNMFYPITALTYKWEDGYQVTRTPEQAFQDRGRLYHQTEEDRYRQQFRQQYPPRYRTDIRVQNRFANDQAGPYRVYRGQDPYMIGYPYYFRSNTNAEYQNPAQYGYAGYDFRYRYYYR